MTPAIRTARAALSHRPLHADPVVRRTASPACPDHRKEARLNEALLAFRMWNA